MRFLLCDFHMIPNSVVSSFHLFSHWFSYLEQHFLRSVFSEWSGRFRDCTVIPWCPQGINSMTPCRYQNPLEKHVVFVFNLPYFKSSLDSLQCLTQCKCIINSYQHVANSSFALWNFLEVFSNIFDPWLVESMKAETKDAWVLASWGFVRKFSSIHVSLLKVT